MWRRVKTELVKALLDQVQGKAFTLRVVNAYSARVHTGCVATAPRRSCTLNCSRTIVSQERCLCTEVCNIKHRQVSIHIFSLPFL